MSTLVAATLGIIVITILSALAGTIESNVRYKQNQNKK